MGRSPKVITATLFVSVFLGALDIGVVVPALTAIIQEWSVPYQWGIWTITLYLLMFVISMPVVRSLSKLYGRQYILCVCLALFGAGAVLSGFAPDFSVLLAGRFLQGIGGGGILTLASVVLGRQGTAYHFGLVGVPLAAGGMLAFLLGSILVTALHWRWIFYVQIAVAFLSFALILRKPGKPAVTRQPLDVTGILLFTSIILCLMAGLMSVKPERFWQTFLSPDVFPFIVVAVGLIIPFVMVERHQDAPIIPLRCFYRQHLVLVFLISLFSGISWVSLLFIPAFAENMLLLEPGAGGYMLSIFAVVAVISIAIARLSAERYGAGITVATGFLLASCGFLMLGTLVHRLWSLVLALSILGLGLGAMMGVPFKNLFLPQASQGKTGPVFFVVHYFRVIGMTVGPAVLVTFLTQATDKIPGRVRDSLVVTSPNAREVSGGIFADLVTGSSQFMVPNPEKLKQLIPDHIAVSTQELILRQITKVMRGTLTEGYQDLFVAATIFSLIGFVCTLALLRLEQDESEA